MKRFISICLGFLFVCALAACSNTEREDGSLDEQETSPGRSGKYADSGERRESLYS